MILAFLFTDIEGSSTRWLSHGRQMPRAVKLHNRILRSAIVSRGGRVFKTGGDAYFAFFNRPADAVCAAVDAQHKLAGEDFSTVGGLKVRMAIHVGTAEPFDRDYFGPALNCTARLIALAHGGQILVSESVAVMLRAERDPHASHDLRDLGCHTLDDPGASAGVFQVLAKDIGSKFPPLRKGVPIDDNTQKVLGALAQWVDSYVGPHPGLAPVRNARLRGLGALVAVPMFLTVIAILVELPAGVGDSWKTALTHTCWVAYDPTDYDPRSYNSLDFMRQRSATHSVADAPEPLRQIGVFQRFRDAWLIPDVVRTSANQVPALEHQLDSVQSDLQKIRSAGFQGVVTYTSNGLHSYVPRIAHKEGLRVIMGIWDPSNVVELNVAAQEAEYVLGYVVGHLGVALNVRSKGIGDFCAPDCLERAMSRLRDRTGRPVATILYPADYQVERYKNFGDWIFPDVHQRFLSPVSGSTTADIEAFRTTAAFEAFRNDIVELRRLTTGDQRPMLLAAIAYPWRGIEGASLKGQRGFFDLMIKNVAFSNALSVQFVVHGAFDAPWKVSPPFEPWDQWTGVLETSGAPRPAAAAITSGLCGAS